MAKAKMHNVIIDRTVVVELDNKPTITYPAGWRGAVNGATLKVIKEMEAGRVEDSVADTPAAQSGTDTEAEIKAKHDAADAEIKKKMEAANSEIAKALTDARTKADGIIADAKAEAGKIAAAVAPDAGKPAG